MLTAEKPVVALPIYINFSPFHLFLLALLPLPSPDMHQRHLCCLLAKKHRLSYKRSLPLRFTRQVLIVCASLAVSRNQSWLGSGLLNNRWPSS